jgi:hypothetical protein
VDTLTIHDQRPGAQRSRIELQGVEKAIYEYCDAAHSLQAINRFVLELGYAANQDELRRFLDAMVAKRLMLADGGWYLSLAIIEKDIAEQVSESQIIQQALAGVISKLGNVSKEKMITR